VSARHTTAAAAAATRARRRRHNPPLLVPYISLDMTTAAEGAPLFQLLLRLLDLPDGFFEAEARAYTRPVFRST